MPQQVKSLGRRGLYNQVFQRGELPFLRIQCRESYPPPSRLPARSVRGRAPPALAHPPPVREMGEGGWPVGTGGGDYSIHLISKGAVAPFVSPTGERSHLPVRSVLGAPHWGAGPEPAGETVSSQGDDGGGLAGRLEPSPLPPPVVTVCAGEGLAVTGGGVALFLSQGGRGPPWESPFSRGRASLREGGVIAKR